MRIKFLFLQIYFIRVIFNKNLKTILKSPFYKFLFLSFFHPSLDKDRIFLLSFTKKTNDIGNVWELISTTKDMNIENIKTLSKYFIIDVKSLVSFINLYQDKNEKLIKILNFPEIKNVLKKINSDKIFLQNKKNILNKAIMSNKIESF